MALIPVLIRQRTLLPLIVSTTLVNFGPGTNKNQVFVINRITPNGTLAGGGAPVSGSNVTIGSNPIRNSSLGTIKINDETVGVATSFTGSLIETANSGKVDIKAP